MGRDAVEEEELVEAKAKEDLDVGLLGAALGLASDEPVKGGLPTDTAINQFLGKAAVVGTHLGGGKGVVEEVFDEGVALEATEEDAGGEVAGGGDGSCHFGALRGECALVSFRAFGANDAVRQVRGGAGRGGGAAVIVGITATPVVALGGWAKVVAGTGSIAAVVVLPRVALRILGVALRILIASRTGIVAATGARTFVRP